MTWQELLESLPEYEIRDSETTNEALQRLGFHHARHNPEDPICRDLRQGRTGPCFGRHVERIDDGQPVLELGCSPPVSATNKWIRKGCEL